jgi:prevent-host-death family protein
MPTILSISKAREELPSLVSRVNQKLEEFVITVKGSPAAVLLSASEYESWKETMEILADQKLVAGIKTGEKEIENGETVTLEEILEELNV